MGRMVSLSPLNVKSNDWNTVFRKGYRSGWIAVITQITFLCATWTINAFIEHRCTDWVLAGGTSSARLLCLRQERALSDIKGYPVALVRERHGAHWLAYRDRANNIRPRERLRFFLRLPRDADRNRLWRKRLLRSSSQKCGGK